MYPRPFAYVRARDPRDAIRRLAEHGEDAGVLAGGMSLVPMMKYRLRSPGVLVDIGRLAELAGITVDPGVLRVGATTRHHEAASWSGHDALGMVGELAARIGDPQVRNMGTVGGGLAAVEPTGDWGSALLAMRGEVVVAAEHGERVIASDDLFVGTYRTAMGPDELLTELRLPIPRRPYGTAFAKFENRTAAGLVGCAGLVELGGDGRIARAGLGCTGVADFPVRLGSVEEVLVGESPSTDVVESAVEAARSAAGARFRGAVLGSLVREVVHRARERARSTSAEVPA